MIHVRCPKCGEVVTANDDQAGKTLGCTRCRALLSLPPAAIPIQPHRPSSLQAAIRRLPLSLLIRLTVWAGVFVWCMLPIIWLLITMVFGTRSLGGRSSGDSYERGGGSSGSGPNLFDLGFFGFGCCGGGLLITLFVYALWCALGVVCGYGLVQLGTAVLDAGLPSKVKQ